MFDTQDLEPIDNPTALKIIDAAGLLFMQRGYRAVSINDIIRAAAITKPTLYYYFADKEELFLQTGLRVLAVMGARLKAAGEQPGDTAVRLRALADEILRDRDSNMSLMRHEMSEHLGPAHRGRLARAFYLYLFMPILRVMEEGLERGELAGFPATTLATMFLSIAESFHEFTSDTRMSEWADESALAIIPKQLSVDDMVHLFMYGVSPAR